MIYFYSTRQQDRQVSFRDAVMKGIADDGGLFMPHEIIPMDSAFLRQMHEMTFPEIALAVAKNMIDNSIPEDVLIEIILKSCSFDAPLFPLTNSIFVLELFHGPTLSFKDFGARFMGQLMSYFARHNGRELTILVATSGDTGSAIADAFYGVQGIRVVILYPKGKISAIQEKQMTTYGRNITALEVNGTFDDCQSLVKKAFGDKELNEMMTLTSANSINIARLIPQSFYYFYAYAQMRPLTPPPVISVPSGNFGNLTAGLLAMRMGLPVARFVAATNINDTIPKFLETGHYSPEPSKQTISNAMDVGNPSNFARILDLYQYNHQYIIKDIVGACFTDEQIREGIKEIFNKYGYIADPHGAVAYLGLVDYQTKNPSKYPGIFLETAHPAKFLETVQPLIDKEIHTPERLKRSFNLAKQSVEISSRYDDLKEFLLSLAL